MNKFASSIIRLFEIFVKEFYIICFTTHQNFYTILEEIQLIAFFSEFSNFQMQFHNQLLYWVNELS